MALTLFQDLGSLKFNQNDSSNQVLNFIINQRNKFGWLSKIPAIGIVTRNQMEKCIDDLEARNSRVKQDTGQYIYCVYLSDVKKTILYSPYDLLIVEPSKLDDIKNCSNLFTVTASNITKVRRGKKLNFYIFFVLFCFVSVN